MPGHKAIFFDRDNTLIVNDGYLGDPTKVELIEGAAAAVGSAVALGFIIVTVSNQSGVARGYFDASSVVAVNQKMDQMLLATNPNAKITRHYYCPFLPDATVEKYRIDSPLRKPAPGMLLLAAKELDLDLKNSWLVGDADRDVEAGIAAGCRTVLFTPLGVSRSTAANGTATAEHQTSSLVDAIGYIAEHS